MMLFQSLNYEHALFKYHLLKNEKVQLGKSCNLPETRITRPPTAPDMRKYVVVKCKENILVGKCANLWRLLWHKV